MPDDCLFCRMAAGTAPVDKLYEDDLVFSIRDINPRAPAHVMIIPKRHIPSVRDLTDAAGDAALLSHIFATSTRVADELGLKERGYRLAFNVGDEGGQTIYHLHLHLLGGRRLGAEG
jgi:histidine triad (HIT) family protein